MLHALWPTPDAGTPPAPQAPGDASGGVEPHGTCLLPGLERTPLHRR